VKSATPKVREALHKWAPYPTEIEADLLPGIDIHDWHRGTLDEFGALKLSSRRLLVLLSKKLPETGAYKTARRGGYLSEAEIVPREIYNELAHLRASYYAINGGPDSTYEPFQFVDPVARVERLIKDAEEDDEAEEDNEQLYGDMGMT
jgi:hypothetical protein